MVKGESCLRIIVTELEKLAEIALDTMTTTRNGLKKALQNLIKQLSVYLWRYNVKTFLCYWTLHPVVEKII